MLNSTWAAMIDELPEADLEHADRSIREDRVGRVLDERNRTSVARAITISGMITLM